MKAVLSVALMAAGPALADLDLRFVEGAPTDRFSVTNVGTCPLGPESLRIDLGGSAAGLIFDTTNDGLGVSVYQPFVLIEGADRVTRPPIVGDGDTSVTLVLSGLMPGQTVAFTIDVDDTLGGRETIVAGNEIEGAQAILEGSGLGADFDATGRARLPLNACIG